MSSTRSERAAGEPERPRPQERSRIDDEDLSRLEERRPSREWNCDQSFQSCLTFLPCLLLDFSFIARFAFAFTYLA